MTSHRSFRYAGPQLLSASDNTMTELEETANQKQARLRRERRNAKIQAGGSARLAAIMNSSGREHAAAAETSKN